MNTSDMLQMVNKNISKQDTLLKITNAPEAQASISEAILNLVKSRSILIEDIRRFGNAGGAA